MNLELFKKHPYMSAAGGALIFVLFYLFFKSRSSSSTSSGTSVSAVDAQQAQVDAAESAAQMQMQGQIAVAQIQAGVQNNAIQTAADVQNKQNDDALAAIQSQYTEKATEASDVLAYLTNQTNAAVAIAEGQQELSKEALADVKDVNGSQNRTSIIESAMGNVPGSVVSEQGQTVSSESGDKLLSSVGSSAGSILSALFG